MAAVSPDSVAQDQIKALVERIERLEEERKAIARDIAEVYAEAKGNGFDRKALKQVVRIRAMDHNERMELDALVELYLNALGMASLIDGFDDDGDRRPHVHVHVREDQPAHDPETGEIIETSRHGAGGAEDEAAVATVAAPSSANSSTAASQKRAQTATEVGTGGDHLGPASRSSAQAKTGVPTDQSQAPGDGQSQHNSGVRVDAVEPIPHPVEGTTPTSTADGDRGGQVPPPSQPAPVVPSNVTTFRTHNPETHFLNSEGLPRLHGCLKAELCGSAEPRKRLCFPCSVAHDGPTPQVEGGAT